MTTGPECDNITLFQSTEILIKAFVYFNLHTGLWSVKALEGELKGKVVGHAYEILLKDCEFKVSEAGRQRVLREQRKNVHAGVVGTIVATQWSNILYEWREEDYPGLWDADEPVDSMEEWEEWRAQWEHDDNAEQITYNPYRYSTFVAAESKEPIYDAPRVWMEIDYDGRATVFA